MRKKFKTTGIVFATGLMLFGTQALAENQGLSNLSKNFTDPSEMTGLEAGDQAEMNRTWEAALVRIPTGKGKSRRSSVGELNRELGASGKKYPVVIYMHGCSGIWQGTHERVKFFADNGFLVIAPASFARAKYPQSCDIAQIKAGLYRGTLALRQSDAGNAIEKAGAFNFVDASKIVLAGLSQGGVTTATFKAKNKRQKTAARIIEGWTCHAGWSEYKGINAGADEPVLSIVGSKDPWFQNDWTRGECGPYMNKTNGSVSVVYSEGDLAPRHELLEFADPRKQVLSFLSRHLGE